MWPIKTKEEIHDAYMLEISSLKNDVEVSKYEIKKQERKIERTEGRIKQLKDTAKLFE